MSNRFSLQNKLVAFGIVSLAVTGIALAQDASVSLDASVNANVDTGTMPPPRPPMSQGRGMMGQLREMKQDFKQGMQDKNMATPTPWKDMRGDLKNLRSDMKGMMASVTASLTVEQKTTIASKLGITLEALNAELAKGTPLPEIIGVKISPQEMMKIMPMASGSLPLMMLDRGQGNDDRDRKPKRGLINSLFAKFFGKGDEMPKESMEINADTNVNVSVGDVNADGKAEANVDVRPGGGIRNFFKRFFNF